jgi:hypothetical protein
VHVGEAELLHDVLRGVAGRGVAARRRGRRVLEVLRRPPCRRCVFVIA